jgi:hypothetical protein
MDTGTATRRLLRLETGADGATRFAPLDVPLRAELAAWLAAGPCDALPPDVRAEIAASLAEPPPAASGLPRIVDDD